MKINEQLNNQQNCQENQDIKVNKEMKENNLDLSCFVKQTSKKHTQTHFIKSMNDTKDAKFKH